MKFIQGVYNPRNPDKYLNLNGPPVFRSSWERQFMIWADTNPNVIEWSSESCIIPYVSPIDNKIHRYFVDFSLTIKNNKGEIQEYLVEVKPESQAKEPRRGRKKEKTFINEILTYEVNQAKWEQAKKYCEKNGKIFLVMGLVKGKWEIINIS